MEGALRIGIGKFTTEEEISQAAEILSNVNLTEKLCVFRFNSRHHFNKNRLAYVKVEESLSMRHCSLPALGVDCGFSLVNRKIE